MLSDPEELESTVQELPSERYSRKFIDICMSCKTPARNCVAPPVLHYSQPTGGEDLQKEPTCNFCKIPTVERLNHPAVYHSHLISKKKEPAITVQDKSTQTDITQPIPYILNTPTINFTNCTWTDCEQKSEYY